MKRLIVKKLCVKVLFVKRLFVKRLFVKGLFVKRLFVGKELFVMRRSRRMDKYIFVLNIVVEKRQLILVLSTQIL